MRTRIISLPTDVLKVHRSIPVEIKEVEDGYIATAPQLAILVQGAGKTPRIAREGLRGGITLQYGLSRRASRSRNRSLANLHREILKRMNQHISPVRR